MRMISMYNITNLGIFMMVSSHLQVILNIWYEFITTHKHIHTIFHTNKNSFSFLSGTNSLCVIKNTQFHTHKSHQL